MAFLTRDPDRAALATIHDLTTRRDSRLRQLAEATAQADAAVAEQRRLLTEVDNPDAAAVRKAGDAVRKASEVRVSLEDAARAIAEMIADAQAGLDAARDRRAREAAAKEQEAGAERIEAAAERLDDAARAFATARKHMLETCRADAPRYGVISQSAAEIVMIANAGRLAGVLPADIPLIDIEGHGVPMGVGASLAAAFVANDMRSRAASIRTGLVEMAKPKPAQPKVLPWPKFPETTVVLMQAVWYQGYLGQVIELHPGGVQIAEPMARAAVEKGVGFWPDSRQGQVILRAIRDTPNASFEKLPDGSIRSVAFTGILEGEGRREGRMRSRGRPPGPPPMFLGKLGAGPNGEDFETPIAEAAE